MTYEPKLGADGTPIYDSAWATLHSYNHFAIQGQLYDVDAKVALVIVAGTKIVFGEHPVCHRFEATQVVMRRNGLIFCATQYGKRGAWHDDANEFETICKKFDKMWPLHFLAKEWPKELGHGLHNDHGAVV